MSDRYVWKGKSVSALTADELREWLHHRPQLFTHSVEVDGMSLSMVNPALIDDASANRKAPRERKPEAG